MKKVIVGGLLAIASLASAQDSSLGIRVRVGYGWTGSFTNNAGSSTTLSGPEIAANFPLLNRGGFEIGLEPSYLIAGRLLGKGTKGDIYHFTLTGTKWFANAYYLKGGVGFAHGEAVGGSFSSQDGVVGQLGVGYALKTFLSGYHASVEANYYASNDGQLRGVFVGLTASF